MPAVPHGLMDNVSVLTFFILSGLNYTAQHRTILFVITLLYYSLIWIVNAVLIVTIVVDRKLHEPMYIFLCNLCVNALYGTTGFYPKFLIDLQSTTHVISFAGCFLQSFVIYSSAGGDLSILAVMAYDRYVALCKPLIYHSVMTRQRISLLVAISWLLPLFCMFINTITIFQAKLCSSHLPKLYCANSVISKLACSTSIVNNIIVYFNIAFYCGHFVLIIWSYMYLIRTCLKSKEGRSKFMQTCLPHLISLINFGFAVLFDLMYSRFGSRTISQSLQNFMAIEFLLIPPLMNPLIYGLNLTKIRKRILGGFSRAERKLLNKVDQSR